MKNKKKIHILLCIFEINLSTYSKRIVRIVNCHRPLIPQGRLLDVNLFRFFNQNLFTFSHGYLCCIVWLFKLVWKLERKYM